MLPCIKFALGLSGAILALTIDWIIVYYNMVGVPCDEFNGRCCNNRGEFRDGACYCDPLFSGTACEHTGVVGYLASTNEMCNGNGDVMYNGYTPPECVETTPNRLIARKGGWNTPQCRNRLRESRKRIYQYETADPADVVEVPMCLCRPGFAGPGCADACPRGLNDEICTGNGNKTVDLMRNGTEGEGCQCTSILPIAQALPVLTREQRKHVADNIQYYDRGLCARIVQTTSRSGKPVTVLAPAPTGSLVCYCDERSFGEKCESSVCSANEEGALCNGNGHKSFGFGAEFNTTRAVSTFGEPGVPWCANGAHACGDGRCVLTPSLCKVSELACPTDRPYRCSTTSLCVGKPKASRCDDGWEYGYVDDPMRAPRRPLSLGNNRLDSRLVAYFFRTKNNGTSVQFTYRGVTRASPNSTTFWFGAVNESVAEAAERMYDAGDETEVQVEKNGKNIVEFRPAHFVHGSVSYDPTIRLRSSYNHYSVLDVTGSRVELSDTIGSVVIVNLTSDEILRPGGSVVPLSTCLDDLSTCAWTPDQSGPFSLCERNGRIGSVRGSNACEFPTRPFLRAETVAIAKPRVQLTQWQGDARWYTQPFVGSIQETLYVEATGTGWVGEIITLDDLRVPCVCEPSSSVNASAWNAKWSVENTRAKAVEGAGYALGKTEVFGDGVWERGILQPGGRVMIDARGNVVEPIVTSKVLTLNEYTKGAPTPTQGVYPMRCPDGRGARPIVHFAPSVPSSTNCTLTNAGARCDNGCVCTLLRCVCPSTDLESEQPLFERLQSVRLSESTKCYIIKPEVGNWTREDNCFQFSTFDVPHEFIGENITRVRARFYSGAWTEVEFESTSAGAYPVVDDVTKPFDEWCVDADSRVEPVFMPTGISAYRTHPNYTLTGSEDQGNVSNVVWNDDSVWSTTTNGFLRLDFLDAPVRMLGVFISFKTMGLYMDSEIGSINLTLHLQTGTLQSRNEYKVDWNWKADVVGGIVDGTYAAYYPFPQPEITHSVRLTSHFPMSIRRFVPITDQVCSAGVLIPGSQYPENVVGARESKFDLNTTEGCVSDDSCILMGKSAANDGVCSEYKFLTLGMEPTEVFSFPTNLTAIQTAQLFITNYTLTDANASCVGQCCAFGILPSSLPSFACNDTAIVVDNAYVWINTYGAPFYVPRQRSLKWGTGLIEGINTCANGTDYTDCGASTRLLPLSPGLSCVPTPLELAFQERNTSVREFQSSALISELLGMGMQLNLSVSWTRDVTWIGRGPCGDCDGRTKCLDGSCVDYAAQCPTTFYKTPGDGCVKIDPDRKSYKCACAVGFSGLACEYDACVPMDPNTGKGDPHSWCTCSGENERAFPRTRVKPPFLFKVKNEGYTRKELLAMNRARKRVSDRDVGMENVRFTDAPWGYAIKTLFNKGGVTKISNCPYLARTPSGKLVDLEDCVAERSPVFPREVLRWKEWPMTNGSMMQIKWDGPWYEFKYNEVPYRCPSGACVSDERECYMSALVNPPCGGRGTCRADGTCVCESEWETFVLTNRLSQSVAIPYASKDGVSDPTEWTTPDSVWSHTAVCKARNCTTSDCSPPYGCFVGTAALGFADKNVTCELNSGHKGMCAVDAAACRRGAVSPPIPCSGNGILRKRDYKDEWYCECGTPRSVLIKDASRVRETTELIPNGFGGPRCEQYLCQDSKDKIWYQRTDPRTDAPYIGSDGIALPGKWRGPCEAPVGPKIEEMGLWRQCCDKKRLDQCTKIPCLKGRVDQKRVVCEEPHLCLDANSKPLVYACNGHGEALADGTCACSNTETEGFTYDESVWTGKGCIRRVRCDISQSGTMCNKKRDCDDFEFWSETPKIPYFEQQWPAFLIRAGLPPTNATFVDIVFQDDREANFQYFGSQQGQKVLDSQTNAANSVCVVPNDDPNNPFGMLPYDPAKVCSYAEGFDSPYLVTNYSVFARGDGKTSAEMVSILSDGVFGEGLRTGDFLTMRREAGDAEAAAMASLTIQFSKPTRVRGVRLSVRSSASSTVLDMFDEDVGSTFGKVCSSPAPIANTQFDWIGGSQNIHYCVAMYSSFNFRSDAYLPEFKSNCVPDEFALKCTRWKDTLCSALGHTLNPPGQFLKLLPGCATASRCCVATTTPRDTPISRLTIRIALGSANTREIQIGEMQVYGSYDQVEVTPPMMSDFIAYQSKFITECRDQQFMTSVFGGQSLTAHLARNWTAWPINSRFIPESLDQLNFTQADDACEAMGSRFASNRGGETSDNYADVLGRACFTGNSEVPCFVNARERNTPYNPVEGDVVQTPCTVWGCWTPNWPLNKVDYFSTARNDTSGLQWMSEWAGSDYLRLDDAIVDLIEESRFQSSLEKVAVPYFIGGGALDFVPMIRYHYPIVWSRREHLPGLYWDYPVPDPTFRAFARNFLYTPIVSPLAVTNGTPYPIKRAVSEVSDTELRDQQSKSIWTNPKTCSVTVYSVPMCGIFGVSVKFVTSFERITTTVPPECLTGGAKKTFYVTPKDDYLVLQQINILSMTDAVFDECIDTSESSTCAGLGQRILNYNPSTGRSTSNVASISMSGPCALEIVGVKLKPYGPSGYYNDEVWFNHVTGKFDNQEGVYSYYIEKARDIPTFMDYIKTGAYGSSPCGASVTGNGNGRIPNGCYGGFNSLIPVNQPIQKDFLDPQTAASFTGSNTNDVHTSRRTRFPADALGHTGLFGIRVMARFTTRKIEMTYRANVQESTPRNENDYVLGIRQHPYKCTRLRMLETIRVFAGVRFPELVNRDIISPDIPVRIGKQNVKHKIERWSTVALSISESNSLTAGYPFFTDKSYILPTRNDFEWSTNVPRESMPDEVEFTAAQLREGMQQLINIGYSKLVPRLDPTDPSYVFPTSNVGVLSAITEADRLALLAVGSFDTAIDASLKRQPSYPALQPGIITAGSALESSEVVFTVSKCDGIELPREVKRCNACLVSRDPSWEWNQKFYNPQNILFLQSVDTMSSKTPQLHASWNSTRYPTLETYQPLSKYEFTRPDAYARLWSTFTLPDYRRPLSLVNPTTPAYYYDSCVVVDRECPSCVTYTYNNVVCENPSFRAVCLYDYVRYTVQSGCQCDVCGPSSRSTALQPNSTVFDLFPLAKRDNFPIEHAIKDAWLEGRLADFFKLNPVPADAVVAFLMSTPNSFINAFPGFYRAFWYGISDRPGFLSRGQLDNPDQWIDLDFKRMFPHPCGVVYSRFTGEGRPMCAKSAEFCSRDTVFETLDMAEEDYPRALLPLPDAEDPRSTVQCGRLVRPFDLLSYTEDEPPPPNDGLYIIQEFTDEHVTIKTIRTNAGSVRNTFRDLDVIKPSSVLKFEIECVPECEVILWIGSTNPFFQEPSQRLDLGTVSTGVHSLTVPPDVDLGYRNLGWDVLTASVGTIIKLGNVLITDDDSIAACRRSKMMGKWVEPPANVDSPAPQHQCVFTDRIATILGVRDVGVCWCSDASPYGGPGCEWLATKGKHGKRVCGMFEGVRTSSSKAISPNGQLVTANTHGVYQYTGTNGKQMFGCKMRSDIGSILKSRLIPNSMSDFRYVVKSLARPNEEEFVKLTQDEIENLLFNYPVRAESARDVCAAFSAALPSFTTADEIESYDNAAGSSSLPTFLDFGWVDTTFKWLDRGEKVSVYNSTVNYTDVCLQNAAVCRSLNFNNRLFNTSSSATDGRTATTVSITSGTSIALPIRSDFTERKSALDVMVLGAASLLTLEVKATNGTTYYTCPFNVDKWTCSLATPIWYVQVGAPLITTTVSEVGAFWTEDGARTYIFV